MCNGGVVIDGWWVAVVRAAEVDDTPVTDSTDGVNVHWWSGDRWVVGCGGQLKWTTLLSQTPLMGQPPCECAMAEW
jgi:hypothetical protein